MTAKGKKYNFLKLKLSRFVLDRGLKDSSRQAKVCSIHKAKSIGVTFTVSSSDDLAKVRQVLKQIGATGAEVFALGYIPNKKPDDYFLSQKGISFFSDKDLDWLLRPTSEGAVEFQNKPFDLLIDLGSDEYYPMHYLLSKSNAGFKIGWFGENNPFDLMMNIDKNKGIEYFCEQALDYLSKFNN